MKPRTKTTVRGRRAQRSWTASVSTPYVPSPLLYDGFLYLLKSNSGILSAFDAKSGKPHYQLQRLEGMPDAIAAR
jgi:outer membrane protein assembly factor BamB